MTRRSTQIVTWMQGIGQDELFACVFLGEACEVSFCPGGCSAPTLIRDLVGEYMRLASQGSAPKADESPPVLVFMKICFPLAR